MIKPDSPYDLWENMPEFIQPKKQNGILYDVIIAGEEKPIKLRFESYDDVFDFTCLVDDEPVGNCFYFPDRKSLADAAEQNITDKTKSIWYPYKPHRSSESKKVYISETKAIPHYPVYIVSKGRARNGLTTKALSTMGVPHYIVIEKQEREEYEKHMFEGQLATLIDLPASYLEDYDTCDNLGNTKSMGPGAARNFCLDHSKAAGSERHWVMDDNLDAFHYLNRNEKYEVETGETLCAAEDFVDRFSNVPVAGLNYYSFCKKHDAVPPFVLNTRIYSCLLIENNSGYRWRGRYNEDTDLSLRVLKDGLCTIQFNAFLCGKVTTQRMRGGNSEEFYDKEGTLPKSQMIADLHPDVAKVVWKFNRWHHHVDYRPYKSNQLERSDFPPNIRQYSLILVDK